MNTIAEIGINHNGSLETAFKLIDIAAISGFDYVKFQKRSPDVCVPEDQKNIMKETPWGTMTYLKYKNIIEFGIISYERINEYCKNKIKWFASVWDLSSAEFMKDFCDIVKVPSAKITDLELVKYCRDNFKTVIISTGMSNEKEIEKAISFKPDVVMHTNSSYPSVIEEINLNYIKWLQDKHPDIQIGYSGHEYGLSITFAAVAMGVNWIERHITLDHLEWGSDHFASVEPVGMFKLIKGIRDIEKSMGESSPRKVFNSEISKRESLR